MQKLRTISLISYALMAVPLAFAGIPIYIYAPDYYATNYQTSIGTLGSILFFIRIIDAIQDPAIGMICDKYNRLRLIIIAISALILPCCFLVLFWPSNSHHLLRFTICVILTTSAFSVLSINLNSLGGLWSNNQHHKTIIASYREAFGLVGLMLATILPGAIQYYTDKQIAFFSVSVLLFILMLIGYIGFVIWYKQYQITINKLYIQDKAPSFIESFKVILGLSQEIKRLYLTYILSMSASAIPAVLVLFFIRDKINLESYAGLFLFVYFSAGALGLLFWQFYSKFFGEYFAWRSAMLLAIISFIWAFFLQEGDFWQYLIICIFSGVAFGAELMFPTAIIGQYIHHYKLEKNATLYYGILAFCAKFAYAFASFAALYILDIFLFVPAATNNQSALLVLSLLYSLLPCIIKCMAIASLKQPLTKANSNEIYKTNFGNDYVE